MILNAGVSISVQQVLMHPQAQLAQPMMQKQHLLLVLHLQQQSPQHLALPGKMTQKQQQHPWSPSQQLATKRPKTSLR
jgi:hypothetical protein